MGCVLPAGQGQAAGTAGRPRRQAAGCDGRYHHQQGLRFSMKATMLAHDIINAGSAGIVVSGGMESMTTAPYLLAKARSVIVRS